jgi:hypothetical protein
MESTMTSIWFGFLLLGGTVAFATFVVALRRWPVLGALSAAIVVLISWELPHLAAVAEIAGTSVYFLDVLCVAFIIVAGMTHRQLFSNLGTSTWLWLGLGLLLSISLGRGLAQYSFGATMNEFRLFFYSYAALTWAMSCSWNRQMTTLLVSKGATVLGWSLTLVAVYHIALHGLGSTYGFVDAGTGAEQTARPLVSGQSLILAMCSATCLWLWRSLGRTRYVFYALVFGAAVALVQQRTVWGVAVAAVAVVSIVSAPRTKAMILALTASMGIVLLLLLASTPLGDIAKELQGGATDTGTYEARVTSWLNLIEQSVRLGPEAIIFGAPMGIGFGRLEGAGRWVEFAPHNWYLTLYLRAGVVGLVLFIGFLTSTLVQAIRSRANMAIISVLVMMIVYGWSYSWLWYTCIFAGWAYCSAMRKTTGNDLAKARLSQPAISSPEVSTERRPKVTDYKRINK